MSFVPTSFYWGSFYMANAQPVIRAANTSRTLANYVTHWWMMWFWPLGWTSKGMLTKPRCEVMTVDPVPALGVGNPTCTPADLRATCWIRCGRVCHSRSRCPGRWVCKVSFSPSPPALSFPSPHLCCGARAGTGTRQCQRQSSRPGHWW